MSIEIIKCELDKDFLGLSIARKQYTEVNGAKFYSELQRRAFRKQSTDENGNTIINPNFSSEVDEWTGVTNFITTQFNF